MAPKAKGKAAAGAKASVAKAVPSPAAAKAAPSHAAEKEPDPKPEFAADDAHKIEESEAKASDGYDGEPLDVPVAIEIIKKLTPADMKTLAGSSDPAEQLPARMMLEHVGDKDTSWKNAAASLLDGANFKKEILDLTKTCAAATCASTQTAMDRLDSLGRLNPASLKDKNGAAFAMAVFMEAIITAIKKSLGSSELRARINGTDGEKKAPAFDFGAPPSWPITIPLKQIDDALAQAWKHKRTPLVLGSGKIIITDTYLQYRAFALIDAKMYVMKKVKKEMTIEDAREEVRKKLAIAIKNGRCIHIAMSNSAAAFKEDYCTPESFPDALFDNEQWLDEANYGKVFREDDLKNWPGAYPGKMREECESMSLVTSDFTEEAAREHLPKALPYFDKMAIICIDPSSIDSDG